MSARVQSVAVVGRDAPAWIAAVALHRALGRTGLRVQVVELPSRQSPVDVYAAVPSIISMHGLLGLDERLVIDACRAVPMVGQRFSNWAKAAPPFVLGYDDEPPPGGDLPFSQYWVKGALAGLRVGFEDFSLGSACARAGRVPIGISEAAPMSASYGYHIDAPAYSELLRQFALKLGIESAATTSVGVDAEGEQISALVLDDGSRVEADLYIDASGREGRLIGKLAGAEFESWSDSLPCDRLLAASGPRLPALPAFSQVSAFHAGWVAQFPLQHRTALVAAYRSGAVDDGEVAELAALVARLPIAGDVVVNDLRPGIQRRPWIGNCVAVGEAAIAADPLDALELHVAHGCIAHLVTLFPATAGEFPEADPFNRSITTFGSNLRDFQAAHYKLNRRFDEPFWDRAREAAPLPSLARRLDVFEARAAIPLNDEESFQEQTWAALFLGCGLMPKDYDPRIDAIDDGMHIAKVQQRLKAVAEIARGMPPIEQFLAAEQLHPAEGVS